MRFWFSRRSSPAGPAAIARPIQRHALGVALIFLTLFSGPARAFETHAPVAYLVDLSSGQTLLAQDADRRIEPASMTKMMTAYVILDMVRRGELSFDREVRVKPEIWQRWHSPGGGSTMFLRSGEVISIRDLLSGLLAVSGNDAAYTLADAAAGSTDAFVRRMNATARALGMAHTHFGSPSGWPDGGVTHSSARDLALLATATIRRFPEDYRRFYALPGLTHDGVRQHNKNPLLGRVEGADGVKTGFHAAAGHCLTGSAERDGHRLLLVVAGLHGESARATEAVRLMQWGFSDWRLVPVAKGGAGFGSMPVSGGEERRVRLVTPAPVSVTVPAAASGNSTTAIATGIRRLPLSAPVRAGQHVADLIVTAPGGVARAFPLVAAADVPRAGALRRLWNALLDRLEGLGFRPALD